jgi:hypothetical protein
LKWLFLASLTVYLFAVWKVSELPHSAEIKADLQSDPLQMIYSNVKPFELNYGGSNYELEPVAKYEISGMIVSHNDVQAFDDIYHTSNSVDVRDLCLVWGQNVEDDNHLSFNFKNEPWSCHISQKSYDSPGEFKMENLSNNHLLVASSKIRDEIYSLHPGDQVKLTGQLVNYGLPGEAPFRRTSQVRTDEGNGACEVMFVEQVKVLFRWRAEWWKVRTISAKISLASGVLLFLALILRPIWANEKRKRETDLMVANHNKKISGSR